MIEDNVEIKTTDSEDPNKPLNTGEMVSERRVVDETAHFHFTLLTVGKPVSNNE